MNETSRKTIIDLFGDSHPDDTLRTFDLVLPKSKTVEEYLQYTIMMKDMYEVFPGRLECKELFVRGEERQIYFFLKHTSDINADIAFEWFERLEKANEKLSELKAVHYRPARVDELEKDIYYDMSMAAEYMENLELQKETALKAGVEDYPELWVRYMYQFVYDSSTVISQEMKKDIELMEKLVKLNTWANRSQKAWGLIILERIYAKGMGVEKDISHAYSLLRECEKCDSKVAAYDKKNFSKKLFGKISYCG